MTDIIDEPPLDTGSIMHFEQRQFQTAYFVIGEEFREWILTPRVRWVINTCWAVGVGTVRVNARIWLGLNTVYRKPAGRKLLKLLDNLPQAFNDHHSMAQTWYFGNAAKHVKDFRSLSYFSKDSCTESMSFSESYDVYMHKHDLNMKTILNPDYFCVKVSAYSMCARLTNSVAALLCLLMFPMTEDFSLGLPLQRTHSHSMWL